MTKEELHKLFDRIESVRQGALRARQDAKAIESNPRAYNATQKWLESADEALHHAMDCLELKIAHFEEEKRT